MIIFNVLQTGANTTVFDPSFRMEQFYVDNGSVESGANRTTASGIQRSGHPKSESTAITF